jgi:hypothetical protein
MTSEHFEAKVKLFSRAKHESLAYKLNQINIKKLKKRNKKLK